MINQNLEQRIEGFFNRFYKDANSFTSDLELPLTAVTSWKSDMYGLGDRIYDSMNTLRSEDEKSYFMDAVENLYGGCDCYYLMGGGNKTLACFLNILEEKIEIIPRERFRDYVAELEIVCKKINDSQNYGRISDEDYERVMGENFSGGRARK